MKNNLSSKPLLGTIFIALTLLLSACGGGGGDSTENTETVTLAGKALLPAGVDSESIAASNAALVVLDLERVAPDQTVAEGMTDPEGNYSVQVLPSKVIAIVVSSTPRTSGLITARSTATKDFDSVTDVACEAGVSAVNDGSIGVDELNQQRIDILEQGAEVIIAEGGVDFLDPMSVSEAAKKLRDLTNNGASPLEVR